MIETRAPGKLYIAGEYAVVEPGNTAILVGVDRYLTVRLSEGREQGRIVSSAYGQAPLLWERDPDGGIVLDHNPYDYVVAAISLMERLRAELGLEGRYFDIEILSELDDTSGRKFGLGSSAAVAVAVIAAIDEFYDMDLDRMQRFRLAMLTTIQVAPNASGGDVATSTFGGWLSYTSPDREALRLRASVSSVGEALVAPEWDMCAIRRLPEPAGLRMLVGWTGEPASTERLVTHVKKAEPEFAAFYSQFLAGMRDCVAELIAAWEPGEPERAGDVLAQIRLARRLLHGLGQAAGSAIETPELRTLCDVAEECGGAAKPSGAGGGDCGIVLLPRGADTAQILKEWELGGIRRLSVSAVAPTGGC